jgi:hypothetical protein
VGGAFTHWNEKLEYIWLMNGVTLAHLVGILCSWFQ